MSERRVAVVTGGGTGIGLATAEALAAKGFAVVIAGRRQDVLDAALAQVRAAVPGAEVAARVTDVGQPDEGEALIGFAEQTYGGVDVLVTAAAIFEPTHILDMTADAWDRTLDVDLRGTVLCGVAAAKRMRDAGGGRIILISSINGAVSEPETAHYSAAKAAIISLARSMALDLAEHDISVNAVAPGWANTPLIAEFVETATDDDLRKINPLARLAEPHELGGFIAYLASDAPAFLTCSTLVVDGGQTAVAPMP
jgi:NAD(P)-dependent dehydrogenase (short-subunit alcohol dehydrogenase family)